MDFQMSNLWPLHAKGLCLGAVALCLWVGWPDADRAEGEDDMRLITEEALAIVTIMQEAAGEPYEGKLAVAEVIRNRMQQRYSSDGTVAGTVLRPYQFSGWNTADPGRVRNIRADTDQQVVQDCSRAWTEALAGSNLTNNAVLYYNPDPRLVPKTPDWAMPHSAEQVAAVGRHVFFVPKVKRGTGGSSEV